MTRCLDLARMTGVAILLLASTAAAAAQSPAEFYRGRTISLLIGFGVGGEDDLWARTISRHIGNHLAGNPLMVPQNVPGSGGLLVANRIANTAPRDGSVIGMINRGIPFEPLLGGQGIQFDVANPADQRPGHTPRVRRARTLQSRRSAISPAGNSPSAAPAWSAAASSGFLSRFG
jgi:hypothetical protein